MVVSAQDDFYDQTTGPANKECVSEKGKRSLVEVWPSKIVCSEERLADMKHIHPQPLCSLFSCFRNCSTTKFCKNLSRHEDSYPVRQDEIYKGEYKRKRLSATI